MKFNLREISNCLLIVLIKGIIMGEIMSPTYKVVLGVILAVLALIRKGVAEKPDVCVSFKQETNYFDFLQCKDSEFCCGKPPHQKCCPVLSIGAIFGIVLSLIVLIGVVACSVVACCLWCYCCPYRSHLRRFSGNGEPKPEDKGRSRWGHPLTLRINTSYDPADSELSPPTETDVLHSPTDMRVSVDLYPSSVPVTPETPMSISSPTEFSKLIAHDWNRHKVKEETSPNVNSAEPVPGPHTEE